ncbi:MAG TPA: neutral zinc metallopeptidase [Pyrinomonadaceae bacterium]|nr:neutral zinc metallopeptidase [Pyrinomonadaceae bacterium]
MLEDGQSSNIEDRRGMGGRGLALGGGGLGTIILALAIYLFGGDPSALLSQLGVGGGAPSGVQQPQQTQANQPQNDSQKRLASTVLVSTERVWNDILPKQARVRYVEPKLVLFTNQTQSACGYASSATGPFYCPGDEKLYLDFAFFNELKNQFGAPGDFAQAYVIAHEVGHHVQNLLGTMDKVNAAGNTNALSVKLELQADCYAGVWAFYVQQKGLLEAGDVEEALRAASAVGDDSIQKKAQGYVVPESFTHGSARERMSWFNQGFQSGDIRRCNTFGTR